MTKISMTDEVRGQIRDVLLEDKDLINSVRRQERTPIPGDPERFQCEAAVAIRRPLDLETAVLRQIRVSIRQTDQGWEIYAVEGLA